MDKKVVVSRGILKVKKNVVYFPLLDIGADSLEVAFNTFPKTSRNRGKKQDFFTF